MNAGGGSQFDATKVQAMIDKSAAPTDAETKYQNLVDEESARLKARPSPEVSEADRKRIIDEQFQQYQAASKPYYDQMQKMIDEERAAIKERYADKAADAMIRAGLRGLSARKPGMQGFFEGATEGMDYYDKAAAPASTRWCARSTPRSWHGSALEELVPFTGPYELERLASPVNLEPTPLAARMGVLRLADDPKAPFPAELRSADEGWSQLEWAQRIPVASLKPASEVLAESVQDEIGRAHV